MLRTSGCLDQPRHPPLLGTEALRLLAGRQRAQSSGASGRLSAELSPGPGRLRRPCSHLPLPPDIKFISSPPSMVAAGSVVAAVQGLHLGSADSFLSYPHLTHFLSTVIKCDPVSGRGWPGTLAVCVWGLGTGPQRDHDSR